ncbi:MAG TPA: thiol-activated cytolysin family protein, partial [Cytophagales bacterium]|nr:thiol-activated cytolysin family protein [Cytophagales bacterium]
VEVAAQFSFRKDKEYNRFLVKLNQSFYTLSFDVPTSLSGLFAPEVTPEELGKYVGAGNPATFVSDVTYGRVYYMLIESTSSSTDIEAAVNASFSNAVNSVDISLNTSYLSSLSEMQIKVVALGGESKSTFATIGETNIANLVTLLGESTDIRSGVPVSYVVRSVKDREVVSVKLATEYEVKTCVPLSTSVGIPIVWFSADDLDVASSENPCTDCLAYDGKYRYYGPNDSYAREYEGQWNGTVVKKWRDISGSGFDASAVANDPDSRPMYVEDAFDNGKPAVDFFRGSNYEYTYNRLTYSGGVFVNRDYTIFAVVSYPDKVKIEWKDSEGNWAIRRDEQNMYGYFMRGSSSAENTNLSIGFQNATTFRLSHRMTQLYTENPAFVPEAKFKVFALRFSKTEGMAIYENGVLIAKDKSKKTALESYEGAMICAPFPGSDYGLSRIRIGEIKAYGVAATEAQIVQETNLLNAKYGL